MNTSELQTAINKLKEIREAANWAGKFTFEVREVTRSHRYEKIAHPLDELIAKLETELARRQRKRRSARRAPVQYRAPYSD